MDTVTVRGRDPWGPRTARTALGVPTLQWFTPNLHSSLKMKSQEKSLQGFGR